MVINCVQPNPSIHDFKCFMNLPVIQKYVGKIVARSGQEQIVTGEFCGKKLFIIFIMTVLSAKFTVVSTIQNHYCFHLFTFVTTFLVPFRNILDTIIFFFL